jgi:hypothetical protein
VSAFEIVVIVVAVVGIGLALTPQFSVSRLMSRIGRTGGAWIDHREDLEISDRPADDGRDEPIPSRPLRGRPS